MAKPFTAVDLQEARKANGKKKAEAEEPKVEAEAKPEAQAPVESNVKVVGEVKDAPKPELNKMTAAMTDAFTKADMELPSELSRFFEIVEKLHTEVVRNVQFRLVASMNFMVIFNVLAHVRQQEALALKYLKPAVDRQEDATGIDRIGVEDRPIDEEDYERVIREGGGNTEPTNLDIAKLIHIIRDYFYIEVTSTATTPVNLTYQESIRRTLTQEPRARASDKEIEDLVAILEMPEIINVKSVKAAQVINAKRSQGDLEKYRSEVLDITSIFEYGATSVQEADEAFCKLPLAKQRQLVEMLWRAITGSMSQAASRLGERGFDVIGAVYLLKNAMKETEQLRKAYDNKLRMHGI